MIASAPGHCLSLFFLDDSHLKIVNFQYFSLALYTRSYRVTDKA